MNFDNKIDIAIDLKIGGAKLQKISEDIFIKRWKIPHIT